MIFGDSKDKTIEQIASIVEANMVEFKFGDSLYKDEENQSDEQTQEESFLGRPEQTASLINFRDFIAQCLFDVLTQVEGDDSKLSTPPDTLNDDQTWSGGDYQEGSKTDTQQGNKIYFELPSSGEAVIKVGNLEFKVASDKVSVG